MTSSPSTRREFFKIAGATASAALISPKIFARPHFGQESQAASGGKPDHTLRIQKSLVEIGKDKLLSTTTYNGQFPRPLLRFLWR